MNNNSIELIDLRSEQTLAGADPAEQTNTNKSLSLYIYIYIYVYTYVCM